LGTKNFGFVLIWVWFGLIGSISAQDQILLHSTQRSFGTFWDHGAVSQPQDGALESIANQIVLNAIQTAKNQLSK